MTCPMCTTCLVRCAAIALLLCAGSAVAGEHPPVPAGAPASTTVSLAVDGHAVAVYERNSLSYASFPLRAPLQAVLTARMPVAAATVRPLARAVQAAVAGATVTVPLDRPGQYRVDLDDGTKVMLFANPPEEAPPQQGDPGVRWFGPGYHDLGDQDIAPESGQTVYLAAGAYVQARQLALRNVTRTTIRGRGILAAPIVIANCRDILVEGLVQPVPRKAWMNKLDANIGVTYRNVKPICLDLGVNNDGFDIMSGNHRILIEDCFVRSNDDVIAFKHHPQSPGYWVSKTPTSGVDFRRNVVWNMNGGNVFEIGVETCGSSIGGIRISDCDVIEAGSKTGAVFDIASPDHVRIHDVLYERIRVEHVGGKLIDFQLDHGRYKTGQTRGSAGNLFLRDIDVLVPSRSSLGGVAGSQAFSGVHLHDVRVQGKRVGSLAEMGATAKDVHGITFNEDRRPTEDRTPPAVIATLGFAVAGAPQLIQIAFDEQIDPEIAAKPATWTPRPDEVRLDPGLRHVTLVLPASAERPTVSFLGLADLHGNILAAQPTIAWSDAFDAAAALPPLQGLAGFWFEQFNPEPVMTWSGRPDLMQTPTHWLISWLPDAAGAMAWTGHDANLLIDGSRMQVSERFQPVRCWRAPLGGRVRITGTVTPVHGPLRARITRLAAPRTGAEGETLWGWQDIVAATGHGVEVTVQRDDLIRCSLAAPEGGRPGGQIADWAPRISYLAIP